MTTAVSTPAPARTTPGVVRAPVPPEIDPATGLVRLPAPTASVVGAVARSMRVLNRWFMVPAQRAGLGAWIGTPIGGYILLLRVRGRRTGEVRETPLSYLVAEGSAWVMAGFGTRTQWYLNLLADPHVEVRLPGRTIACLAEEVTDPETRARLLPVLVRAAGVPGLLVGCDPWSSPDDRIVDLLTGVPLIRLAPLDGPIAAGPDDPGGRAWIWRQALVVLATLGSVRLVAAIRRRSSRSPRPRIG